MRHRDFGQLERDVAAVRTTLAPILISFSRGLVSDHCSIALSKARVRMKLPRLYARAWSSSRTALAANERQESRVHLMGPNEDRPIS